MADHVVAAHLIAERGELVVTKQVVVADQVAVAGQVAVTDEVAVTGQGRHDGARSR